MTPVGFFTGTSRGSEQTLAIVRSFSVTRIGQVHQSLFNPDLVREALAGDPRNEVRDAGEVMNLDKVIDSGPAPIVAITSHSTGSRSAADLVMVEARITDKGKGIGRIEWRVNGVTAAVAAKPSGDGPEYTIVKELALDAGDNTIEVVAYNASNLLASLPALTTIKFTGPADQTKPTLHILAIGINKYVDRGWTAPNQARAFFPPLTLAVKDAETFGAAMKRAAVGLYDKDKVLVTTRLDEAATRASLDETIDKLAGEIHPRDTFILFVAAHGIAKEGHFYLIPQDYDGGPDPTSLAERAIDQSRLQDWLANRIKAKKAIILLDTCESGALVGGYVRPRDLPAAEAAVGRLHEATGRPVLTAAASGQFAHEGKIAGSGERHGIFTWALLDALRKGDKNGDGLIQLSELVGHVQRIVPELAEGSVRAAIAIPEPVLGVQTPRFGSRGEDFALVRRLQ